MDLDEFRSFISDSGVDVWTWMDMAISLASADHETELKNRRDGIVQKLYVPALSKCQNCDHKVTDKKKSFDCNEEMRLEKTASSDEEENDCNEDDDGEEQRKILEVKILLDDQNQSERRLIELLQSLVDMDTTFKALKETDIGRHVTKLRKHSSTEVRRLVKILVRKWKDIVDEWVRLNTPLEEEATRFNDRDSPKEAHHESTHNGVSTVPCYPTPEKRKVKHNWIESDKLVSSAKQNHQENHHGKKQRTSQVLDFHDIPKLKNPIMSNDGVRVPVKYW